MNAPPPDENENVIDIFVLSTSSTVPSLIRDQLEPQGYRVTFFSEGTDLITTLQSGKPNLLICDTSSADTEGYEVCRQIKSDDYLWNIPVLILTGASDLGDLLNVLDSNADNFIAQPYDPPYLISLIEGMLTTPVQRQTAEQIKTQFKISHEDQIFVVTADRRKLLEFLLSSFEIAVNKSSELIKAQDDLQSLGLSVRKLEQVRQENTRALSSANETLRAREQRVAELSGLLAEKENEISEQSDQIGILSRDLDAEKTNRTTAEEEIRTITRERDQAAIEFRERADEAQQRIAVLSAELETAQKDLRATRDSLAKETDLLAEREGELERTTLEKKQVEKEYQALLLEAENLNTSLASEKSRAETAEKESGTLREAKSQLEQDLNQTIAELNGTTKQQESDITRLREELESERTRFSHQEDKLRILFEEKEQTESALRSQIETDQKSTAILQADYDSAVATLEERNASLKALADTHTETKANLADTVANKEQAEILVQSLTTALNERDEEIKSLKETHIAVTSDLAETTAAREQAEAHNRSLTQTIEEQGTTIRALKENLTAANRDLVDTISRKEEAEMLAQSLTRSLEEARAAYENEQGRVRETEERLNAAVMERQKELEDLRSAHDEARSGLVSSRDEQARTKREIESIIAQKATLEGNLGATLARIRELEAELHTATSGKLQIRQQSQSLSDELEQVKLALETERQYHHDADEKLKNAMLASQHLEQEVQRLAHEHKVIQSDFVAEQQLRREAEEQARGLELERENLRNALRSTDADRKLQEDGRSAKIQKLKEDFEKVLGLQRTLEEQVTTLTRDKMLAEQKAANLSAEIDQARTALADEWEDHMTDQERLVAVSKEKHHLEDELHPRREMVVKHGEPAAMVVRGPDLPVTAGISRTMISEEPIPPQEEAKQKPYVLSVEDLFEDDEGKPGTPQEDEVSPATVAGAEILPEGPLTSTDEEEEEEDQVSFDQPEAEEEEQDGTPEENERETQAGPNVSFNRAQWLDLLKWAHHCEVLTHEQRMQIVRMGRLIQKGRNLTRKQEEQVLEIIALVQRLGYRFP